MPKKIALLLFTTSVLLTSFAIVVIPQANALNQNLNVYNPAPMERSHVTDRFNGAAKVCGNHLCAHGERTAWEEAVWDHQKVGYGKVGTTTHGESVMHKLAGSTPSTATSHGTPMHGTMTTNMTNSNMTGNMPSGTK